MPPCDLNKFIIGRIDHAAVRLNQVFNYWKRCHCCFTSRWRSLSLCLSLCLSVCLSLYILIRSCQKFSWLLNSICTIYVSVEYEQTNIATFAFYLNSRPRLLVSVIHIFSSLNIYNVTQMLWLDKMFIVTDYSKTLLCVTNTTETEHKVLISKPHARGLSPWAKVKFQN